MEGEGITEISITDMSGRQVKTQLTAQSRSNVDISQLPHGSYLVTVKTKAGVVSDKVVKE